MLLKLGLHPSTITGGLEGVEACGAGLNQPYFLRAGDAHPQCCLARPGRADRRARPRAHRVTSPRRAAGRKASRSSAPPDHRRRRAPRATPSCCTHPRRGPRHPGPGMGGLARTESTELPWTNNTQREHCAGRWSAAKTRLCFCGLAQLASRGHLTATAQRADSTLSPSDAYSMLRHRWQAPEGEALTDPALGRVRPRPRDVAADHHPPDLRLAPPYPTLVWRRSAYRAGANERPTPPADPALLDGTHPAR